MPWVVPAMTEMTTTPIAQREIDVVTRSQTSSQRSSSPGMSTLASARLRFTMSLSRNRQMKRIVNAARNTPKKLPAMPSTPEIASGIDTETSCAPSCTFSAAPESPSQESSSDSRRSSTIVGSSWRKSRTLPTRGTSSSSMSSRHRERAADDRDRRREPPRHAGLLHHEAHRVLEDEREEDADEHDEEGVADRREGHGEAERPQHEEQRAHRQEKLDASRVRRVHGAKGYAAVRLEQRCV